MRNTWIRPPNAGPYLTVAALLSVVWYVVLISLGSDLMFNSVGALGQLGLLAACCGSSIVVALRLRGFIVWSDSAPKALAAGLLLTISVTVVLALAISAPILAASLLKLGSPTSWGIDGALMLFLFLALQIAGQLVVLRFFVVLPLGLFSQYALARVTHGDPTPLDRKLLAIAAAAAIVGAFYFALQ